jgi:superfamily II DNA or RNA helicase
VSESDLSRRRGTILGVDDDDGGAPGAKERVTAVDTEHGEADRDDLVREVAALREENARLRGLLGLDTRASGGHEVAWSPTLLPDSPATPSIDASAPEADKVDVLRSLFGARSDVYAVRWEQPSTGTAGWSPATKGGSARRRSTKDYLPLTDEVFVRHLRGQLTVGIYPLLPGDHCALLACDFDKGSWALDALAYLDACHANGVPAALERSRSGNGAHVWVFLDRLVRASEARAMDTALLRQAMMARGELDLASYDRFFPSQDFLPKAGFGNLIALPLHGGCVERGTTTFLDPTTMQPWPDQWAFLSSVARMSPPAVAALTESLRPAAAGPLLSLADLANAAGPPPAPAIHARFGSMLSIERAGLPPAVVAGLKHLGSIANPEFHEKQRMRFSTWNTPRYITAYEEDLEYLHLPRGLTERVVELIEGLGSRLDIDDDRPAVQPVALEFVGELRPQQAAAVSDLVDHERGVLVAPPGAGKTVMACAVIAHHKVPTLVIVDRKELIDQWRSRLAEHLGLDVSRIGQVGGGSDRRAGLVDVAMIQSLTRRDDQSVFEAYGLVVVDECHHIPAVSFQACVQRARSRRWLGLTATPYRRDRLETLISFQCGPTRHEIKPLTVEGADLLRRELVVHHTETKVSEEDIDQIQRVFETLVEDRPRTTQICRDVHGAVTAGRTCLVLTQRTDHIDKLVAGLADLGSAPLVLRGGLGKRARAAVAEALATRDPDAGIVLVATGSYLGEGFDWPELDTLFLAFPLAFKGRVVQYVGRLLRSHAGKHHVELHDYVDRQIPVLDRMHTKRHPAYRTLGFEIPARPRRSR